MSGESHVYECGPIDLALGLRCGDKRCRSVHTVSITGDLVNMTILELVPGDWVVVGDPGRLPLVRCPDCRR